MRAELKTICTAHIDASTRPPKRCH